MNDDDFIDFVDGNIHELEVGFIEANMEEWVQFCNENHQVCDEDLPTLFTDKYKDEFDTYCLEGYQSAYEVCADRLYDEYKDQQAMERYEAEQEARGLSQ